MSEGLLAHFIVNGASGNGRGGGLWKGTVEPLLKAQGRRYDVSMTQRSGHASEIAREILQKEQVPDVIVSVGGDGTHHEVVNGFFPDETTLTSFPPAAPQPPEGEAGKPGPSICRLGFISSGSGQDFIRTIGLQAKDHKQQISAIYEGRDKVIDLGLVECANQNEEGGVKYSKFLNEISFGLAGETVRRVNGSKKPMGSTVAYVWNSFLSAATYHNRPAAGVVDGHQLNSSVGYDDPMFQCKGEHPLGPDPVHEAPWQLYLGAVCNGKHFGSGMMPAPDAELDDGVLELVVIDGLKSREMVTDYKDFFNGRVYGHHRVKHYKVNKDVCLFGVDPATKKILPGNPDLKDLVEIESDGELMGTLPARASVIPSCVTIRIPAPSE